MKITRCFNPIIGKVWLTVLAAAFLASLLYTTAVVNPATAVAEETPQIQIALKSVTAPVAVKKQKSNDLNQLIRRYHRLLRRRTTNKRRIMRVKAKLAEAILSRLTIVAA